MHPPDGGLAGVCFLGDNGCPLRNWRRAIALLYPAPLPRRLDAQTALVALSSCSTAMSDMIREGCGGGEIGDDDLVDALDGDLPSAPRMWMWSCRWRDSACRSGWSPNLGPPDLRLPQAPDRAHPTTARAPTRTLTPNRL